MVGRVFCLLLVFGSTLNAQDWNLKAFHDYSSRQPNQGVDVWKPESIQIRLNDDLPFVWRAAKDLEEVEGKLDWKVTPESSKYLLGNGGLVLFDAPEDSRCWHAHASFKDLDSSTLSLVDRNVASRFGTGMDTFYLLYTDSDKDARTKVAECSSLEEFRKRVGDIDNKSPHRILFINNVAWLAKIPSGADKTRRSLVESYLTRTKDLAGKLEGTKGTNALAAASLRKQTDELFSKLNAEVAMDDKLEKYQNSWKYFRERLDNPENAEALGEFRDNLMAAVANNDCTVTVFASKGHHAEVRVAKSDKKFRNLGTSVVNCELERATYFFQSWRNGKKTGETSADCTGKTQSVTIVEK